ncbi:MAG: pyridoxal-phosphate dependent enzyme [Promethearchaeota archaeon]
MAALESGVKLPRLVCTVCGSSFGIGEEHYICPECGGTLDITYDLDSVARVMTKDMLRKRYLGLGGMWRYREVLPVLDMGAICTLGEGSTPLIKCTRLSRQLGIDELFIKNECLNPTGSFKARQVSVGVSKALEFKRTRVGVVSSGNVGLAAAAYCARAGLHCTIVIWGKMSGLGDPLVKMAPALLFGANVNQTPPVDSPYFVRDSLIMMRDFCIDNGWVPLISARCVNPFAEEGAKTMAYEICEAMDWTAPDWICAPIGGGGLLSELWKGCKEMEEMGLIDRTPRIAGFQSGSFQQVAHAYLYGSKTTADAYEEVKGFAPAYSLDGDWALQAIKESNGFADIISIEDVIRAQRVLAENEGIIAEPMAAWGLAGTITALEKGRIQRDETVVTCITGQNLEYTTALLGDRRITSVDLSDFKRFFDLK